VYDWRQNYSTDSPTCFPTVAAGSFSIAMQVILKVSLGEAPDLRSCGLLEKGGKAPSLIKSCIHHWLSLCCVWSNLVTSPSRPIAPAFIAFFLNHQETNLLFPDLGLLTNILINENKKQIQWLCQKLDIKCDCGGAEKIRRRRDGLSTTSTPWKFGAVSRRNLTVPVSRPTLLCMTNFPGGVKQWRSLYSNFDPQKLYHKMQKD